MKKRFLIFLKSVHFILFLFAIGLTTVLFLFSDFPIEKYKTEVKPFLTDVATIQKAYFDDLDSDGNSELVQFFDLSQSEQGQFKTKIKIMNSSGKLVDEWNVKPEFLRANLNSLSSHDINQNNIKEIYFFTLENDSVFVWSFEMTDRNKFLIERLFIFEKPKTLLKFEIINWEVFLSTGFGDVNNDHFDDLIITAQPGYNIFPRRLILVDVFHKQLLKQTPDYGNIGTRPFLLDINNDGKMEITFSYFGSPGNIHFPILYDDYSAWLMVFDTNLNFIFPPLEYPEMTSSLNTIPIQLNGNKLLVSYNYDGNYAIYPKVMLFNSNWEKSAEKTYPLHTSINSFQALYLKGKPILVVQNNGDIDFLDEQLNTIKTNSLDFTMLLGQEMELHDVDENSHPEIIINSLSKGVLQIINDTYDYVTKVNVPTFQSKMQTLEIAKDLSHGNFIVIKNDYSYYQILYSKNPYYYFTFLIIAAVFLIIFSLLEFIFSIFQSFYMSRFATHSSHSDIRGPLFVISLFGTIKTIYHIPLLKLFPFHHHFTLPDTKKIKLNPDMLSLIDEVSRNSTPHRNEISFSFNSETIKVNAIAFPVFGLVKFYPVCYAVKLILNPEWEEKNSLWSKTIQKLVHDIKTPVSTVQMNIQTLKWKVQDQYPEVFDSTTTEWGFIETELNRLKRLTKSFLKLNDLEKPNFQNVSVKEIIDEVHQHFSAYLNEHIKFITDLDPDHDLVVADSFQIQMIFQVLIENSIDAIKDSGIISVSSSLMESESNSNQEFLLIEVSDTGNGISKEDIKKIFEPHFTTKKEGSGLGLSIAKKIVEDHGGEIWVHSTENFATVFSFTLPLGKRL